MNYRERCYRNFVSKHWKYIHVLSKEEYDFHSKLYAKTFLKHMPKDKNAVIMDVACGAGHFMYFLKKEGYQNVVGIDISSEQLELAKQMDVRSVKEEDLFTYLPQHSGQYDMILGNDIIEHLNKDEVLQLLDAMFTALKPGGKILISTENAASLFGASRVFIDFTHEQGFTPISLNQVLRVCGFDEVSVYGIGPIHNLSSLIRVGLWKIIDRCLKFFLAIECGLGRGLKKRDIILEPRMFAIAKKPKVLNKGGAS
ncbi:class I SAM-dependent methyltransferase [bacterium]|nr:class I SAM-dependent methyltransferase [bacterium]